MAKPPPLKLDAEYNNISPEDLIEDITPFYEDDQLSAWETKFIENIISQLETDVVVTEKQMIKLREIHMDYCIKDR